MEKITKENIKIDLKEKIKYIELLLDKREVLFFKGTHNLYIHCILNTMDINELIEFYLPLSDSNLKRSIESNLYRRIEFYNQRENLFEKLLSLVNNVDYKSHQRIRKLLLKLLESLEKTHKYSFFEIFYNSKYINDIYAALSVSKDIWNDQVEELVLIDYLKTKFEYFLEVFLNNGNIEACVPYLEKIWSNHPSNFLKQKIIKHLSKNHIESLYFLNEIDPEKYLFSISISNNNIEDETLINCYNRITENLRPFALLSIGRMNKWELIERETRAFIGQSFK